MKQVLAAAGLCAALSSGSPTWAQQNQPSPAVSVAEPQGTSAPPADPFKDGGRPESHGGDQPAASRNPAAAQNSQPLTAEKRQALETIARTTLTAQQYGNLASKRHASAATHDLGDRMVVTNSRLNRALGAYPDLGQPERMPPEERSTFDALARQANEVEFGVSVAQWVTENYPRTIAALDAVGQAPELREVTSAAMPELRSQLAEAQRILQIASTDPAQLRSTGQAGATGSVGPKRSD
jgi:hypothetical protein